MPVIDRTTGEIHEAQVFIAVLGASNYTYAEATWSRTMPDWIGAHVWAFEFLSGVPELVAPDYVEGHIIPNHHASAHRYQSSGNTSKISKADALLRIPPQLSLCGCPAGDLMADYEKRYPQETKTMAGLRERLLNEGKQQGLEQGQANGERALLIRLLKYRFGELDEATHQSLEAATMADLERWTDNVLEARSLEEVFTRH